MPTRCEQTRKGIGSKYIEEKGSKPDKTFSTMAFSQGATFLEEARTGGDDVVIVTNLGLPLDYSLGLIALLRQACSAKVIVMSGVADQEDRERAFREGAVAFYSLPISGEQILEAVEEEARE